jgi:alpha-beta hydrolase superfamily lysophospholipase
MPWWKTTLIVVGAFFTVAIMLAVGFTAESRITTVVAQSQLDPFYATPDLTDAQPGELIRIERMDLDVSGGQAFRMLYVTERPWGDLAVSGGMVFIPDQPVQDDSRPVVAWAHGTVGQGDACAPSRSRNPLGDTSGWLEQMMSAGWVVTATDYAGLGTQGPNLYLVAEAEVHDVINSVRAARSFERARAGSRYVVWGHSQGGHSSLWSGHLAPRLAPELELLGVAAAAPAAELADIVQAQWDSVVGWVIGPEVIRSWPVIYPELNPDAVLTARGKNMTQTLAEECVVRAAIDAQVVQAFDGTYFSGNPMMNTSWKQAAARQTPPPMPASMPVYIAQSVSDAVVLGWPNGRLEQMWCAAGSTVETTWLFDVTHQDTAMVAGPDVVRWIANRFADRAPARSCEQPPPVVAP